MADGRHPFEVRPGPRPSPKSSRDWSTEVVLFVYPVVLGSGKRFFQDRDAPRKLALVSTKAVSADVLMNTYRHVGSLQTSSLA